VQGTGAIRPSSPPDDHHQIMTSETPDGTSNETSDFDTAQQELMVEIGQALIEQSVSGTVLIELVVTQQVDRHDVDLDIRLNLERQSGLTVPAAAGDTLVEVIQRLVTLWRAHDREPWRSFTYRLTRGDTGPRFTSEFSF
jgi:hypothetical protein